MCGKICKSKGGLTRHINAKHEKNVNDTGQIDENNFTVDDYCKLVNESAKSLSEDECYPESIRKQFETYAFSVSGNLAVKEQFSKINILYTSLRKGKVEKYFALVPSQAFEYFPGLSAQLSVLLATRVADKIVTFSKHRDFSFTSAKATVAEKDLTKNEIAALQYLGGYVLFALNKRIRKSKKWNTSSQQEVLSMLQAGKQSDVASTDQKLVDTVSRGSLWKISSVVEQIFTIAELHFKAKLSGRHVTKIDKEDMVGTLEKNHEVIALHAEWVCSSELEVSKDVSVDILHQVLVLFVTVRSFSFAKDVINKYKNEKKNSKSKAVRTELKRAANEPENFE